MSSTNIYRRSVSTKSRLKMNTKIYTPINETGYITNINKYPNIEKKHENIIDKNYKSTKIFFQISNKIPLNSFE